MVNLFQGKTFFARTKLISLANEETEKKENQYIYKSINFHKIKKTLVKIKFRQTLS